MKITLETQGKKRIIELPQKAKVVDAIIRLGINPQTVLVRRGREIVTDDDTLGNGDELEIIKVVSGG